MKKFILIFPVLFLNIQPFAQHEHHKMTDTLPPKKELVKKKRPVSTQPHHAMAGMPTHAFSRNLPMSRNGSGTGWNPDASPMYMWMKQTEKTDWMFHGNIFLRYTGQDIFKSGSKSAGAFSMPNWFMTMMNRNAGANGMLSITAMISLDRITEGGNGYPLLFQTGETYKGHRLIDRQHPHDLFSALSIGYTHMLNRDMDVFAYFGYPGEPALGAPAFMHRVSAMNNPDAPLGHHWQDATHITFGTGTLGFRYRNFKAEGSIFTGREPDEERFGFDKATFDSYSWRLSFNPSANWAFQVSQGFIKSPEALQPDEDVTRTTASVLYAKKLKTSNHISAAAIWGLNDVEENHKEHSFLLEGNLQYRRNAFYTRYEYVQKSREELDLDNTYPHRNFHIHAFTAGYNRQLTGSNKFEATAGTQVTVNGVDRVLQNLYGKTPVSFQLYLQIRPSLHKH